MSFFSRIPSLFSLTLIFSLSSVSSQTYDESDAVRLFHLAASSYGERHAECVNSSYLLAHGDRWRIHSTSSMSCDVLDHYCSHFIALSETRREVVVAFRGTKSSTQLFVEGWQSLTPAVDFFGMGKVNRYFITAHLTLWPSIEELLKDPKYSDYRITFTGHSLGGALAALAAARTVKQNFRPSEAVKVYTFGEPRVGSLQFARNYDSIVPHSFRVVNGHDIVPHLPACAKDESISKYNVNPCDERLEDEPYHHGTEIWYPHGMVAGRSSYHICLGVPRNEDFACSDRIKFRIDDTGDFVDAHREYFGVKVSEHGRGGCATDLTKPIVVRESSVDRIVSRINGWFRSIGFQKRRK